MNKHLEIEQYLAGERATGDDSHLVECAACRDEVARMEALLAKFGESAREWGRLEVRDGLEIRHVRPNHVARWVAVAAAFVLIAAVPLYRGYMQREAAAQAKADAVLLDAIAVDISRPAPQPLEPLIQLVSTQGENR
jgi:hypothetical protein